MRNSKKLFTIITTYTMYSAISYKGVKGAYKPFKMVSWDNGKTWDVYGDIPLTDAQLRRHKAYLKRLRECRQGIAKAQSELSTFLRYTQEFA